MHNQTDQMDGPATDGPAGDQKLASSVGSGGNASSGQLEALVDDLAMLVRRLAHSLEKLSPDSDLAKRAVDYLKQHGLQGSSMRARNLQQIYTSTELRSGFGMNELLDLNHLESAMPMNKWVPTTNLMMLRRMGKLTEELGELQAVAARCVIQGIDEIDPGSGVVNRTRLENEIADVIAQCRVTICALRLDANAINLRDLKKRQQMAEWEAMFDEPIEV